ncbi:MAG: LysR family transcriptional regulator [Rhodobacteraceae bacterium]|nr:LysR family transcriptional regulator [Paracoccaceae bacterium]
MHRIRWDDLQFIHAVAEHGSLSAAARALGVNHATVLRRIALLEARNGVALFDRAQDGYRLRPEGRDLLVSLKSMERAADRIGRNLAVSGKGVVGSFRLGTTDAIASLLLPKYLHSLSEAHPKARIEVAVSNDLIDMKRPAAEIILRPAHRLPPELSGQYACDLAMQVFGAPDYLAAHPSDRPEDHQWLGVTQNFARSTAGAWQTIAVGDCVTITADSFLVLAHLAKIGLGLVMLPTFVGRKFAGLQQAPQFPDGPTNKFWVATHAEFRSEQHIAPLVDFFVEAIRSDSDVLM